MSQLSALIRITRQRAYMPQEEFANVLGVSVSTINRWETGKVKPNITAMKKIKKFCSLYEIPYDDIEKEWLSHSTED